MHALGFQNEIQGLILNAYILKALSFICQKGSAHYTEILDYNLKNPIVESKATVTLIVHNLTALGLIKRSIVDSRPIRTVYQPTEKWTNCYACY